MSVVSFVWKAAFFRSSKIASSINRRSSDTLATSGRLSFQRSSMMKQNLSSSAWASGENRMIERMAEADLLLL
jgi:hypothetical protein